ncbi:MAG: hypothetical protein ABFD60_07655 [Bryobacteraceae bacterium]
MPVPGSSSLAKVSLLLAVALSTFPQDVNKATLRYEVHGVVLETGTNQPVLDAKVALYFLGSEKPRVRTGLKTQKTLGETTTDFLGAFVFRPDEPGYYGVDVKKDGYTAGAGSSQYFTLTTEEPNREVRLVLAHPGEIIGRVVDAETRKPIPNVTARAWRPHELLFLANRQASGVGRFPGPESITDLDGRFRLNTLAGNYAVEVEPRTRGAKRIIWEFSDRDAEHVDEDAEHSYWPGGSGPKAVNPVPLTAGATVDVGDLPVNRAQYYRAHVEIPKGICEADETLYISEELPSFSLQLARRAPCGKDLLITGFAPGSHLLLFSTNSPEEKRRTARVEFSITDKNVKVAAPLAYGVPIDVKFVAADGAQPPDFTKLAAFVNPFGNLTADAKGRLRAPNVPLGSYKARVRGLGADHYVREVLHNGIRQPDQNVTVGDELGGNSVTFVIDDKPAVITGAVTEKETPVSKPYVILAKWPLLTENPFEEVRRMYGDDAGKFTFKTLAPGEYRIFAISNSDLLEFEPAVLKRVLETSQKVELGPRALKNLTLELWKRE